MSCFRVHGAMQAETHGRDAILEGWVSQCAIRPFEDPARACRALEGRRPNLKAKSCALAAGATNKDRCSRNRTFSFACAEQWVTETEEADAVDEGVASEVAEEV